MLPEEILDFRRRIPPFTDERAQVFQSGDKGNDAAGGSRPILDLGQHYGGSQGLYHFVNKR